MKKRIAFLLCVTLFLFGCPAPIVPPPPLEPTLPAPHYWTFEEVSKPYLDARGQPEEVMKYTSANYSTVDWWWWTQGFEVSFENSIYDDVNGWGVSSTYEFDPIP